MSTPPGQGPNTPGQWNRWTDNQQPQYLPVMVDGAEAQDHHHSQHPVNPGHILPHPHPAPSHQQLPPPHQSMYQGMQQQQQQQQQPAYSMAPANRMTPPIYPHNSNYSSQQPAYSQQSTYPQQSAYSPQNYSTQSTYPAQQQAYSSPSTYPSYSTSYLEHHDHSQQHTPQHPAPTAYAPYALPHPQGDSLKPLDSHHSHLRLLSPRSLGSSSPAATSPMTMSPITISIPYHSATAGGKPLDTLSIASAGTSLSSDSRRSSVESTASGASIISTTLDIAAVAPNVNSKTVQANKPLNPEDATEFNTLVDGLMKAIQVDPIPVVPAQAQAQVQVQVQVRAQTPPQPTAVRNNTRSRAQVVSSRAKPLPKAAPAPAVTSRVSKRSKTRTRHYCQVEGCDRSFSQKSHLDIHHRSHTGEKPYTCSIPECGRRFSQLGNLRTHERLHSGERPHLCPQCGKGFSARGKLKSHMESHNGRRSFVCKLEDCNKGFTQLGNLKAHQNKFHDSTIRALTNKFINMSPADRYQLSDHDRHVLQYFATLYKNSNKGIKGRGKGRKVQVVRPPNAPALAPASMASMPQQMMHQVLPPPHQTQMMHPMQGMRQPANPYDTANHMRTVMAHPVEGYPVDGTYDPNETRSLPDPSAYDEDRPRRMY